jgi:uroporphyrinogen decarboxylase
MEDNPKPLLQALNGEAVWPPPIWLMRQAGRYLPEYRARRSEVAEFLDLCTTPELAADITLQPIRRFGFDGAILFSDLPMVPWALGQALTYREGVGPVLPALRSAADVAALDRGRVAHAIEPILRTVRMARAALTAERFARCALIGFAGAPFTVVCYMVEGGGSRDFAATRAMAYGDPSLFARLLDIVRDATITYLAAQINAGAEAVMLFDSWAGILPPQQFRAHVVRPTRDIVSELRRRYPKVPVIGFPRLAGMLIGEYTATTGVQAVGMDTSMEPSRVAGLIPSNIALQGNLDPLALVAGGSSMADETTSILRAMRNRPFVFNLGHGIVPQTPLEHVAELVELVRAA